MAQSPAARPQTWPELRAAHDDERMRTAFDYAQRAIAPHPVHSPLFAPGFLGAVDLTVFAALIEARDHRAMADALFPLAAKVLDGKPDGQIIHAILGAMTLATLSACAGWGALPDPEPAALLERCRDRVWQSWETLGRKTIWTQLAYGETVGLTELLGQDPADAAPPSAPNEPDDVQALQRRVARALIQRDGGGAMPPLLRNFADRVPQLRLSKRADYGDLLLAGRAVLGRIGGVADADVLEQLRAMTI